MQAFVNPVDPEKTSNTRPTPFDETGSVVPPLRRVSQVKPKTTEKFEDLQFAMQHPQTENWEQKGVPVNHPMCQMQCSLHASFFH